MRKFGSILVAVILLCLSGTVLAAERVPLRVAILPVVDQTGGWLDKAAADELAERLQQEFYVPLNGTLQAVVCIPSAEVLSAYSDLQLSARLQSHPLTQAEMVQQLAQKLSADLVLDLAVTGWYERYYVNWEGDSFLEASVGMTLTGWNQRTGQAIQESASRWGDDDCSVVGSIERQGGEALDEILQRLQLRRLIFLLQAK